MSDTASPEATQKIIRVTLPDGAVREVPYGESILGVARQIGERLAQATVGGRLNGQDEIRDLRTPLQEDCSLEIITKTTPDGQEVIRHSAAHIMADAILRIWPDAKLGIGPAIKNGFYYDIDLKHRLGPDDLPRIEEEMRKIIKEDSPFVVCEVDRALELKKAKATEDVYKADLMENFPEGEAVTFYRHGEGRFEDLCRGPHVQSTGYVKAVKLLRVAGAYWRGDENNAVLQRIYGTAWNDKKELKAHLARLEEAEKRDHRKLGRELGLYMMEHKIAPASPFFLPKGAQLYRSLVDFMREQYVTYEYEEVITPQIFDAELWHKSGHYDHYKENMYFTTVDGRECAVKPMNCPAHSLIFGSDIRSYRDLPMRIADFGRLHRYERSGATHGLTRVRTFCQDDAHLFCAPEQIQSEIASLISMIMKTYDVFGFANVNVFLSTRPEKSVGSDAVWEKAERGLEDALKAEGISYKLNEGDGAFYGPKIDFVVVDALEREWQLGTIQLDFNNPERFDLNYIDDAGHQQRPVMIHRAIFGSLERFIGILIEHTGGAFPFWVAPIQGRVVSINDRHNDYAVALTQRLKQAGFRVESDLTNAKTGAKIRDARLQRIPYRLVVGDREVEDGTVAVREHPDTDLGTMKIEDLISMFQEKQRKKQ